MPNFHVDRSSQSFWVQTGSFEDPEFQQGIGCFDNPTLFGLGFGHVKDHAHHPLKRPEVVRNGGFIRLSPGLNLSTTPPCGDHELDGFRDTI